MQVLGFTSEEQDTIFKILASVLHLGNVYFHRKQMRHGQEGVEVGSDAEIRWAAHLLQVNSDGIIRALTTKTTVSFSTNRKHIVKMFEKNWNVSLDVTLNYTFYERIVVLVLIESNFICDKFFLLF